MSWPPVGSQPASGTRTTLRRRATAGRGVRACGSPHQSREGGRHGRVRAPGGSGQECATGILLHACSQSSRCRGRRRLPGRATGRRSQSACTRALKIFAASVYPSMNCCIRYVGLQREIGTAELRVAARVGGEELTVDQANCPEERRRRRDGGRCRKIYDDVVRREIQAVADCRSRAEKRCPAT